MTGILHVSNASSTDLYAYIYIYRGIAQSLMCVTDTVHYGLKVVVCPRLFPFIVTMQLVRYIISGVCLRLNLFRQ